MRQALIEPLVASGAVSVDLDLTFLAHFLLFTAFVVVCKDLVFEPLMRVFEERERRTHGAVERARKMDERAIELKREYEEKLDGVRRQAAVDREKIRTRLKRADEELRGAAQRAANERLESGIARVERDVAAIRKDLVAQQTKLGAEITSRVLGREVR